jgi:hypothetical protein
VICDGKYEKRKRNKRVIGIDASDFLSGFVKKCYDTVPKNLIQYFA